MAFNIYFKTESYNYLSADWRFFDVSGQAGSTEHWLDKAHNRKKQPLPQHTVWNTYRSIIRLLCLGALDCGITSIRLFRGLVS
jgi:hypothetical protein